MADAYKVTPSLRRILKVEFLGLSGQRILVAFCLALILHLIIYVVLNYFILSLKNTIPVSGIVDLNVLMVQQLTYDERKVEIKPQIDKFLDEEALSEGNAVPEEVNGQNLAIDTVEENETEESVEIAKERLPTISLSHTAITKFVDSYIGSQNNSKSNSLNNFENSFDVSSTGTSIPSNYLIENDNGIVDVKTSFFGKSICYTFDAAADFSPAMFYKCDEEIKFEFKMKK